jgi:DHA2 family multidrug resistance protein
VAREVGQQAQMGAMLDVFKLITLSYLFMVPLVFLLKKSTTQRAGPVPVAAAEH